MDIFCYRSKSAQPRTIDQRHNQSYSQTSQLSILTKLFKNGILNQIRSLPKRPIIILLLLSPFAQADDFYVYNWSIELLPASTRDLLKGPDIGQLCTAVTDDINALQKSNFRYKYCSHNFGSCIAINANFDCANAPLYQVIAEFLNTAPTLKKLTITPSTNPPSQYQSYIPEFSKVQKGKVLTHSYLSLNLTQNNSAIPGVIKIPLQSSRGALDSITGPGSATDNNGNTSALAETRNQTSISQISSSDSSIKMDNPLSISWLPSIYESTFLVTCYAVADEADSSATPVRKNVCGLLPGSYRSDFIRSTIMQGTGRTLDGKYIHYDARGKCFNLDTCARTSNGSCAQPGVTIAVDPAIIPRTKKGATVNVNILGQRVAQDGGGWINGFHIDDFMGVGVKACQKLGIRHSNITLTDY
ncbi:3D domain-containing protein [Chromobacterium sphagni]|uniref:3D domain-containing protein n=1 Tax=Chromobacterium sphagni TaxID=1903179 RepID=UPI000AECDA35|nr:3D domain-containing protein [Chromobacterium sphagni]